MVTVYRGVSDEAIEHLKQNGYLPPSDPDHAIPNDPVLLEALFPEEWQHEQETGDSRPLDDALVEVFPWYDPEDVRRSLRWSANVTTDPGNAEGYGNLIELLVDEKDIGLIDQYGMIRDVRAARMA